MASAARISPEASVGSGVELGSDVMVAPRAVIHDGARIGAGSTIGAGTVIHEGVELGERCTVEDLVVLGKRPRLRPGSSAAVAEGRDSLSLVIEEGTTICCGAVVYAAAWVGAGVIIGDQVQLRERSRVGAGTVVGRGSCVDFEAQVGARVVIQTGAYVTGGAVVEDEVFLGPGVVTTNDHSMGRHPRGERLRGPVLRRACRIGGGAVLLPGVEIGEEAFVAAGSVVTRNVPSRQVVMGLPARPLREVSDEDLIEQWR